MSAVPNGSVLRLTRACVCLACAAVTLPASLLHAVTRHAAPPQPHGAARAYAPEPTAHAVAKHAPRRAVATASASRPVHVSEPRARLAIAPVDRTHGSLRSSAKAQRASAHTPARVLVESPRETRHASGVFRGPAVRQAGPILPVRAQLSPAKAQPAPVSGDQPDHAAEDRVRAWYQARAAAAFAATAPVVSAPAVVAAVAVPSVPDIKTRAVSAAQAPARAAAMPPVSLAASVDSSTEDDAAAIHEESRIPSTAPTERVPAPFTHGDLPASASSTAGSAAKPRSFAPATLAAAVPPALHGPAPAVKAVALAAAHPKLDADRADALAREALDESDAVGLDGRSSTALVGSTANTKLAERPALAVLEKAPLLPGDLFASDRMIAPMRGTHLILVHQNQMAVSDGLSRIENDAQLADMQRHRLLIALPDTAGIQPDGRLPLNRRYARPWTVHFLNDLAKAHYARFGTPLIITSAVRTVAFQRHLVRVNGNAAPPTGDVASPHLYGQAIDLAKHGMSTGEIAWMRSWLTPVENDGRIDVEEEFLQSCFHISVYRRYAPEREEAPVEEAPSRRLVQARAVPVKRRHISTAMLAAGLR